MVPRQTQVRPLPPTQNKFFWIIGYSLPLVRVWRDKSPRTGGKLTQDSFVPYLKVIQKINQLNTHESKQRDNLNDCVAVHVGPASVKEKNIVCFVLCHNFVTNSRIICM